MLQGLQYYEAAAFDADTVHAQCHNGEPPASLVCVNAPDCTHLIQSFQCLTGIEWYRGKQ
eukprot:COSAG02_NODE_44521_length_365_cov_1.071429_1_plen_60_part_00